MPNPTIAAPSLRSVGLTLAGFTPVGPDAGPGNTSQMQLWYRDQANEAGNLGTALSDAVEFTFE